MKLLITGGAGYIGSITANELLRGGHAVVVYDNLSKGHLAAVPQCAAFVHGDMSDRDRLEDTLSRHGIDAVLHFAAFIEAGESMKDPDKYFRNNSVNSLTLLEAMVARGVQRLVFSSTAALYGEPETTPIKEDDRLRPTNAYGESKLVVEQMLAWFHRAYRLRYASLRYFNAAGAAGDLGESHHPESHLIPRILQVAQGLSENIAIFGSDYPTPDGTCVRDYIHVLDLAHAHVLALEALETHDKLIYNLGNGRGFSVREVIECARIVTRHPIPVIQEARRPGDPAVLVACADRIARELNWKPRFGELQTIVGTAWEWCQRHPQGYTAPA